MGLLDGLTVMVVDTETTGFDPAKGDRLVEVARVTIANGAAGRSGCALSWAASVSVISASQSSSWAAGRALSAGIEPTTPALHWATTSLGLLMMKSGAPMIGSGRRFRGAGSLDMGWSESSDGQ